MMLNFIRNTKVKNPTFEEVKKISSNKQTVSDAEIAQLVPVTLPVLGRVETVFHPERPEVSRFVPEKKKLVAGKPVSSTWCLMF